MSQHVVRRLRPHLFHAFRRSQTTRAFLHTPIIQDAPKGRDVTRDYQKRVAQLEAQKSLSRCYPRLSKDFGRQRRPIGVIRKACEPLQPEETAPVVEAGDHTTIAGRVQSVRTASSKLVFADISDGLHTIQVVCQYDKFAEGAVSAEQFKAFGKTARKGDWYAVTGVPYKTARGESSLLATKLPQLLSPSLHQIPETLDDAETRARNRHVDMLANPSSIQPLLVRHHIEKHMNRIFDDLGFTKVSTPLLTAGAGGAVARPFETEATELGGHTLNLRIAPELWLKRLVVGGMSRVYEIGPAFRNEGVDATHNPEFSICEFYEAFATLDDLMARTETMLHELQTAFDSLRNTQLQGLPSLPIDLQGPYKRLEFIPALEEQMGRSLPQLSSSKAHPRLLTIVNEADLPIPAKPTVPRMLDALAGHYLEPLCQEPTFIINHPACLSPLSKYFLCRKTNEIVAARAELFIQGREYANMYEEENSPFEQRRKFEDQLKYRAVDGESDGKAEVDESYLEALEWGLPSTGGWGCGMDRLVMLFSGRERMADVLAFGSLRNVVGLGRGRR